MMGEPRIPNKASSTVILQQREANVVIGALTIAAITHRKTLVMFSDMKKQWGQEKVDGLERLLGLTTETSQKMQDALNIFRFICGTQTDERKADAQ